MAMELDRIELLDESERGEQQMEAKCLFGEQPQPDQISPKRDAVNKEFPMTVGDAAAGSGTVKEESLVKFVQALVVDLTCDERKKAMCKAADLGLTSLIEEILSRGDTAVQGDDALFIQRALENKKYATAIAQLEDEKNVAIWRSKRNKEVLREELAKLVQTLGEQVTASHGPGGEDVELKVATVNAILDTCIVGNSIDCKILNTKTEVQLDGKTWTCHNLIGRYHLKEIQKHESYQTLVGLKWNHYGWAALLINFLLHILFMLVLTGALAFAAESPDPRLYCDKLDWLRLFLEILTIIFTIVFVVLEVLEFINRYRGTKYSHRAQIKRIGKTFYQFFRDWRHVLSVAAIVCTILIIPCRVVDTDWQWRVAAFAFIFNGLRIFEYAVLWTYIGEYTEVLIKMLLHDIPRFALFCIVVAFSLGGGLYFALRGEVFSSANTNSTCSSGAYDTVSETGLGKHRDSTSEIYLPMLHTLRIIAEGSSLDYTEYSWFSILIYWLNVVSVTVILSYLLIAQFTSTYAGLDHAFFDVTLTKADILYRMETGTPPYGLFCCFDFSDDGKVSMMAQRTYVQFDSKENQVQPVDRKLIHVSTTLREHTADVKDVDTRIAEAQQREEKLVKILEQLQAKATPEEGITTSEDASPITRTFID